MPGDPGPLVLALCPQTEEQVLSRNMGFVRLGGSCCGGAGVGGHSIEPSLVPLSDDPRSPLGCGMGKDSHPVLELGSPTGPETSLDEPTSVRPVCARLVPTPEDAAA